MDTFKIVTADTIRKIIKENRPEVLELIKSTYLKHESHETVNPQSHFLRFPDSEKNRIIALPAAIINKPPVSGIKWISSYPDNILSNKPRASAILILNDYETGIPYACLEGSIISAARTAASAALALVEAATKLERDIHSIGIVGTGLIARNIVAFIEDTALDARVLNLFDLSSSREDSFANSLDGMRNVKCRRINKIDDLISCSDVIVFTTTASTPHVSNPDLFQHNPIVLHISLRDLHPKIIAQSYNIVDDEEHCLRANTSLHLTKRKCGNRQFITGSIGQLILDQIQISPDKPVIFSPFGLGILDIALGQYIYDIAIERSHFVQIDEFYPKNI